MYKMIIVDDEPIIQMGLRALLDYSTLNIEIIKTSSTGQEALDDIRGQNPDLVMMDISIPGINGLEVMELIKHESAHPPVFIILSCHDEFEYAKKAVKIGASDYLLKNELTPDTLRESLQKAIFQIKKSTPPGTPDYDTLYQKNVSFLDNFFLKLLNNWFDSTESMLEMMNDLRISFNGDYYVCAVLSYPEHFEKDFPLRPASFHAALCSLIHELCKKYCNSYVTPWDYSHFALILAFSSPLKPDSMEMQVLPCIHHVNDMLRRYQNVSFKIGIGSPVLSLDQCAQSFSESYLAMRSCVSDCLIITYQEIDHRAPHAFNIAVIRKELNVAMDNYDIINVNRILQQVLELLKKYTTGPEAAIVICSSILHFVDISYKGSEHLIEDMMDSNNSYFTLYRCKTVSQVVQWFQHFIEEFIAQLEKDFEHKKNWLLPSIKKYIEEHYQEPISLSDISAHFNVSCGYISTIFKRNNDVGFTECVTQAKIRHAKQLLLETDMKIYDVAYQLGFSDPYYFSKVFKKNTGFSPKEFILHSKNTGHA